MRKRSPTLRASCGDYGVFSFAQNSRDEVRFIGNDGSVSGALTAQPGMKQQTYVLVENKDEHEAMSISIANTKANGKPYSEDGVSRTIAATQDLAIAFTPANIKRLCDSNPNEEVFGTLGATKTGDAQQHVCVESTVRRLTPVECERLQGFPDNWTKIPWKKKPEEKCPDGPRYKAMGNSMAVNVMRWIGQRIDIVDRYFNDHKNNN